MGRRPGRCARARPGRSPGSWREVDMAKRFTRVVPHVLLAASIGDAVSTLSAQQNPRLRHGWRVRSHGRAGRRGARRILHDHSHQCRPEVYPRLRKPRTNPPRTDPPRSRFRVRQARPLSRPTPTVVRDGLESCRLLRLDPLSGCGRTHASPPGPIRRDGVLGRSIVPETAETGFVRGHRDRRRDIALDHRVGVDPRDPLGRTRASPTSTSSNRAFPGVRVGRGNATACIIPSGS